VLKVTDVDPDVYPSTDPPVLVIVCVIDTAVPPLIPGLSTCACWICVPFSVDVASIEDPTMLKPCTDPARAFSPVANVFP
jgi:hypothetical protein